LIRRVTDNVDVLMMGEDLCGTISGTVVDDEDIRVGRVKANFSEYSIQGELLVKNWNHDQ
jgi:hypothetical protein